MCGVAGIVRPTGISTADLASMATALEHRGPDGLGFLLRGPDQEIRVGSELLAAASDRPATVGFAHRRLAIIDLSEDNRQPAIDATGTYGLTYNGEIYNYLELRAELEGLGHSFKTRGDTEVVLRAYMEWGEGCVGRFVGMWAFAILDLGRRIVFLSRDRFGVKPLYYCVEDGALYFASEIKGLLATEAIRPAPEDRAVASFLLDSRADHSELTFFRGILQLRPAHNLIVPLDRPEDPRTSRYWRIPRALDVDQADPPARFRELFSDALRLHGRSDVPVGTCLSGGLDSSGIVGAAARLRAAGEIPDYAHTAFGYVPSDGAYSERDHMDAVIAHTGATMHFVAPSTADFATAVESVVGHQDEPVGSASIAAQWFVFQAAKQGGMKVMLDGQGADEVFGGYLSYLPLTRGSMLRRGQFRRYLRAVRSHREVFGSEPDSPAALVRMLAPAWARSGAGALRRSLAGDRRVGAAAQVVGPELHRTWQANRLRQPTLRSLNDLLAAETEAGSLPALLRYEDRNSMAHSIEARVPFLDHRLVEFAFGLTADWKIRDATTKYVVREGLTGQIPESVRSRTDKVGFRADPVVTWTLIDRHRDSIVANRTADEERWFDPGAVANLVDTSERSTQSEFLAWRVLSVKLWVRSQQGAVSDALT